MPGIRERRTHERNGRGGTPAGGHDGLRAGMVEFRRAWKSATLTSDEVIDEENRRYSALAMLLRSRYLIDVDCWSEVRGQPIKPNTIQRVLLEKLKQ